MTELSDPRFQSNSLELFPSELETSLRLSARKLRLPKKNTLFACGSTPDALYCLESGLIRLSVTASNGREAVLTVLQPGQWFGEAALLSQEPRMHDACAVIDCELLVVPAHAFYEILEQHPAHLREFTRLVCRRYRLALKRVESTILLPLPVRLAQRLLDVLHVQQPTYSGTITPVLRLSQEDLSQMLGVSRQSVNKLLKDWEVRNILQVEYGKITLLDLVALRHLAL